jgi:hypothetical protein
LNPSPITLYSIAKMKPSSSCSTAAVPPAASGPVTVTSVDVLSGRYNYSFNHEGNNFFRDAIQDNREEYQAASRRAIKNQITQSVIRLVQAERGGRFLKLNDKNQWEVMSDDMVYEKVSHALRGSKKKYMQSKKNQKEKNKKSVTAEVGTNANAVGNAAATATSTTGSASSAASSTGEAAAAKGAPSYQALASPFVNRAYEDIMARQKLIFEGMVNGSMLQGGEEDDGDPSVDGGNNSNSNSNSNSNNDEDEDDYDDDNSNDNEVDDGDDNDSAAYLSSRRRDSNATELSSCGGGSGSAAHVAVAARALVAAMRQQERRDEKEEG